MKVSVVALATAYFDESATESAHVVAGFAATVERWKLFDADWKRLLRQYQILQILSITLCEKVPILQALQASDPQSDLTDPGNQLNLFDF